LAYGLKILSWFFIGYWILTGAGFLSWPLFFALLRVQREKEVRRVPPTAGGSCLFDELTQNKMQFNRIVSD
jgi:hypothetical protein